MRTWTHSRNSAIIRRSYVMLCATWYHLYNLKTWKTPMGEYKYKVSAAALLKVSFIKTLCKRRINTEFRSCVQWNFKSSLDVHLQKQSPGGVLWKKVLLEALQNSQENTCTRVCEFCEISMSIFFTEHLRWLLLCFFKSYYEYWDSYFRFHKFRQFFFITSINSI